MPPSLLTLAKYACTPLGAPAKSPGTGPVRIEMLATEIESAVTPTSVAPPLPPAGAAFAPVAPAPATSAPVGLAPAASPLAPPVLVPPLDAPPVVPAAPAARPVPVPPPLPSASRTCAWLARDPQAATNTSPTPNATTRRRLGERRPPRTCSGRLDTRPPELTYRQK